MQLMRQVNMIRSSRPLVLLTVVTAFFVPPGCLTAGESSRVVARGSLHSSSPHWIPGQEVAMRISPPELDLRNSAQESDPPATAATRCNDSAMRRSFPSGSSITRGRSGTGYRQLVKSCSARRIADSSLILPAAGLPMCRMQLHAVGQIAWPIGQSAAESVVLLRRLLI